MFHQCNYLITIGDISNWNTNNVTDIQSMFHSCYSLESPGDLSKWCAENVLADNNFAYYTTFEYDTDYLPKKGEPC